MTRTTRRGPSTGRAARIRTLLAADPDRAWSARELAEALPRGTTTQVLTSLHDLMRRGHVQRVGSGRGATWKLGDGTTPQATGYRLEIHKTTPGPTSWLAPRPAHTGPRPLPASAERARPVLEADVDAFLARGGKIQRLGVTKLFAEPAPAANQPIPAPRARTGRRRTRGASL